MLLQRLKVSTGDTGDVSSGDEAMALDSEEEDSDSDDEGLMEVDEETLEAMAAAAGSASEEDSEEDAGSAGEATMGAWKSVRGTV